MKTTQTPVSEGATAPVFTRANTTTLSQQAKLQLRSCVKASPFECVYVLLHVLIPILYFYTLSTLEPVQLYQLRGCRGWSVWVFYDDGDTLEASFFL